ncbi:hypothetical protein HZC07_00385 [Candidatus Micrarchaeota archaeon]|nr:hypothetical protein [Candidatus Micrarchaeota archaeon]
MKRGMLYFILGVAVGLLIYHFISPLLFPVSILPIFSPTDGKKVISLIDSANKSLDIEMYLLTSKDVIAALERAQLRGVSIRIILERNVIGNDNSNIYNRFASQGFNVRYASSVYKLTHAKFIIVDGTAVLVGSNNMTNASLYDNREAGVIIRDGNTITDFQNVFETDWKLAA